MGLSTTSGRTRHTTVTASAADEEPGGGASGARCCTKLEDFVGGVAEGVRTAGALRGVVTRGEGTEFGRVIPGEACPLVNVAELLPLPKVDRKAADADEVLLARDEESTS